MSEYEFVTSPGPRVGLCVTCGNADDELRGGVCFGCATEGERRVANRSALQHVRAALGHACAPSKWLYARVDMQWAWQRLTNTGDYAPGGYFEREYGIGIEF